MPLPRISVITVSLNSAGTIERTMESVLSQTYSNVEYIIVDGGSTDATVNLIRKYATRLHSWVSEPDKGLYDAMNKGIAKAGGDFVHFLNADDCYCSNDVLERIAPFLSADTLTYGQMIYRRADGTSKRMCSEFSWRRELIASRTPQPVLFVPLQCYREVGGFDLRYRVSADYEMVLRLAARYSMRFADIEVTTMNHGGISDINSDVAFREARDIAIRYGLPAIIAYWHYYKRLIKWRVAKPFSPRSPFRLRRAA